NRSKVVQTYGLSVGRGGSGGSGGSVETGSRQTRSAVAVSHGTSPTTGGVSSSSRCTPSCSTVTKICSPVGPSAAPKASQSTVNRAATTALRSSASVPSWTGWDSGRSPPREKPTVPSSVAGATTPATLVRPAGGTTRAESTVTGLPESLRISRPTVIVSFPLMLAWKPPGATMAWVGPAGASSGPESQ